MAFIAFLLFFSCKKTGDTGIAPGNGTVILALPDTLTAYYSGSSDYIISQNKKATLGRVLFYDKHLSLNNSMACASCHKQQYAFADNVAFSPGYENRPAARNTLPIEDPGAFGILVNQGRGNLFWDGREDRLNYMPLRPIANHVEMGTDISVLPAKLAALAYYKKLFADAYGNEEINLTKIGDALAVFMTSITVRNTRIDQYKAGRIGLSPMELEGKSLFVKYNCNKCHGRFIDGYIGAEYLDIGLDMVYKDPGRYTITYNDTDKGKFRLPNLDNIARTAPYMHDGRFKTLDEVMEFYSTGVKQSANLDKRLKDSYGDAVRLNITEHDKKAIIAYLEALTDYSILTDPKYATPFKQQ